jgi:hypothetical protein
MSRINKLEKLYQEPLKQKDIKDTSVFIQSIINTDITKGKYVRFLIEAFLNEKFLKEDLIGGLESTIGQAISLFDKYKHKLPIKKRSVYALNPETSEALYQSPGDLWNSVKQFQGELSGKELKKEEQEQVYRKTEFVYKDEETGFQIVSPLTKASAKWWGKGTRWCTSAENNNMFNTYAKDSPLLIIMTASASTTGNGDKLQLWKNNNEIQFMDEADNTVSKEYIEQNWKFLEPICMWLKDLRFIPEKYITKESYEIAVKQNGLALNYVPYELRTNELCELAIKQNGKALQWIPDKYIDYNLCEITVQSNGEALHHVPRKHITKELCELAVKQNGKALKWVPEHLITPKLCEIAVQQTGYTLRYVPMEFRTEKLCKIAVKNHREALYYVPKELKTKELCELAIKKNGWILQSLPTELKTKELCEMAVKQNGKALKWVPEELRTSKICEMAVKQNGEALEFVPDEYREELQNYVKDEVLEIPIEKYQETFQEIKILFPIKDVSLSYHSQ